MDIKNAVAAAIPQVSNFSRSFGPGKVFDIVRVAYPNASRQDVCSEAVRQWEASAGDMSDGDRESFSADYREDFPASEGY